MEQTHLTISYMNGVMMASAASIAIAGIIFAVIFNKKIWIRLNSSLLFFSIVIGALSIYRALSWFYKPDDSITIWAGRILLVQFIMWFIPLFISFVTIWLGDGKNVNSLIEIKEQPISADGKEVTLLEIKQLVTKNETIIQNIENRQKRTAWQWPFSLGVSAMAVGVSWSIATTPKMQGDYKTGLFVFAIGLLACLAALVFSYKKNPKK
jgi:hypothetical protein